MFSLQANPMQQSWDKRTPLHFAAQHRHATVIRQLLLHPSRRQSPSSTLQQPPAMQQPPMQTALEQHQKATEADQQQNQHTSDTVLSELPLPVCEPQSAQTDLHNSNTTQKAGSVPRHASIQDAASSLQSLQSGIHFAAETVSRQAEDTASNGSIDDGEQLDYTWEDADAMEALLALTSDCSVQSSPQSPNPAGRIL